MASTDPPEGPARNDEALRASGQRDALLELLAVLSHDLNNPLQTLLVLSELGLDEAPAGSEAHDRAIQCLAAADRLKVLTQAMGGVLRGRPQDAAQLWSRTAVMLGRRLDRYGVAVTLELDVLTGFALAVEAEWAMLAGALAVIATAATSARRRHALGIVGVLEHGEASVLLTLAGIETDGSTTALPLAPSALDRLRNIVPGTAPTSDGLAARVLLARAP
jgi:signal transduction histidine kinase